MVTESDTVVRGLGVSWLAVVEITWDEMSWNVSLATPGVVVDTASVSPVEATESV